MWLAGWLAASNISLPRRGVALPLCHHSHYAFLPVHATPHEYGCTVGQPVAASSAPSATRLCPPLPPVHMLCRNMAATWSTWATSASSQSTWRPPARSCSRPTSTVRPSVDGSASVALYFLFFAGSLVRWLAGSLVRWFTGTIGPAGLGECTGGRRCGGRAAQRPLPPCICSHLVPLPPVARSLLAGDVQCIDYSPITSMYGAVHCSSQVGGQRTTCAAVQMDAATQPQEGRKVTSVVRCALRLGTYQVDMCLQQLSLLYRWSSARLGGNRWLHARGACSYLPARFVPPAVCRTACGR